MIWKMVSKGGIAMKKELVKLLKVKTLVTLILTAVFAYLCCTGKIETREFVTVFTVVISFYFGTQHEKDGSGDSKNEL